MNNSRRVSSNQAAVHAELEQIVKNHLQHNFQKPIAEHTKIAFEALDDIIRRQSLHSIILDSGCGAGDSTIHLAQRFPESIVIGLDKSLVRLKKLQNKQLPKNVIVARADQFDFWRLVAQSDWRVTRHYIFYPNPWPKKEHIKRRIHGHPAFVDFAKVTTHIELCSNWRIYLEEFAYAWRLVTGIHCTIEQFEPSPALSLFEKKFQDSGHQLYRLTSDEDKKWT